MAFQVTVNSEQEAKLRKAKAELLDDDILLPDFTLKQMVHKAVNNYIEMCQEMTAKDLTPSTAKVVTIRGGRNTHGDPSPDGTAS